MEVGSSLTAFCLGGFKDDPGGLHGVPLTGASIGPTPLLEHDKGPNPAA